MRERMRIANWKQTHTRDDDNDNGEEEKWNLIGWTFSISFHQLLSVFVIFTRDARDIHIVSKNESTRTWINSLKWKHIQRSRSSRRAKNWKNNLKNNWVSCCVLAMSAERKWKTTLMERKDSYINIHEMEFWRAEKVLVFVGILLDLIYMFLFWLWKVSAVFGGPGGRGCKPFVVCGDAAHEK